MFFDARSLSQDHQIEADICIIGGGVAGISLALELSSHGLKVALVESGGMEFDSAAQSLNAGENAGREYYPLDATRLRLLGGTSNHWGGHCTMLSAIDFEAREWVPHSGWPFSRSELLPYFDKAHKLCEIGPADYDADTWFQKYGHPNWNLELQSLEPRVAQFSPPTQFGIRYERALEQAEDIAVFLYATTTEIVLDDAHASVSYLNILSLDATGFRVKARHYVLAGGAIENARMLLLSDRQEQHGVGNRNDLVGRFFMEHLSISSGVIELMTGDEHAAFFSREPVGDHDVSGYLALSEADQKTHGLLNMYFDVGRRSEIYFPPPLGLESATLIASDLKRATVPDDFSEHVKNVYSDLDFLSSRAIEKFGGEALAVDFGKLDRDTLIPGLSMEQAPNPDSRITLSTKRDALNQRMCRLDWRLSELDLFSYEEGMKIFGVEMARAGFGRLRWDQRRFGGGWPIRTYGHHHQLGTTRMHEDPKSGVVDADCRVHGLSNLFIAGGSVFPTGGYAFPTINIVALTLRLAGHLKSKLGE